MNCDGLIIVSNIYMGVCTDKHYWGVCTDSHDFFLPTTFLIIKHKGGEKDEKTNNTSNTDLISGFNSL